jgi:hypothetical protein
MDKNKSNSSDEIRKSVGSIYSALLDKRHKAHEEKEERRKAEAEERKAEEDAKYTKEDGTKMSKKERRKSDLERWESVLIGLTGDDLEYSSKKGEKKKKYRKWIDDDVNSVIDVKPKKIKKKNYNKEFEPELNMLRNLVSEQNKFTADLQKRFMNAAGPATKDAMMPNKTLVELASVISSGRSNSLGVLREIGNLKKTIADLYMKQKKLDSELSGSGAVDDRDLGLLGSAMASNIFGSAGADFAPVDPTPSTPTQPTYTQNNYTQNNYTTQPTQPETPVVATSVQSFDPATWDGPDIGNSYTKYESIPHSIVVEKNQNTGNLRFVAIRDDNGLELEGCPVPTSDPNRLTVNEKDMIVKGEFDEVYKLKYV